MTVLELIHQLQTMPPEALVVSEGHEDGYDSNKEVSDVLGVVFFNAKSKSENK